MLRYDCPKANELHTLVFEFCNPTRNGNKNINKDNHLQRRNIYRQHILSLFSDYPKEVALTNRSMHTHLLDILRIPFFSQTNSHTGNKFSLPRGEQLTLSKILLTSLLNVVLNEALVKDTEAESPSAKQICFNRRAAAKALLTLPNNINRTPLHELAQNADAELLEIYFAGLKKAMTLNILSIEDVYAMFVARIGENQINNSNERTGNTPLHIATSRDDVFFPMMDFIIETFKDHKQKISEIISRENFNPGWNEGHGCTPSRNHKLPDAKNVNKYLKLVRLHRYQEADEIRQLILNKQVDMPTAKAEKPMDETKPDNEKPKTEAFSAKSYKDSSQTSTNATIDKKLKAEKKERVQEKFDKPLTQVISNNASSTPAVTPQHSPELMNLELTAKPKNRTKKKKKSKQNKRSLNNNGLTTNSNETTTTENKVETAVCNDQQDHPAAAAVVNHPKIKNRFDCCGLFATRFFNFLRKNQNSTVTAEKKLKLKIV